MGSMNLISPRMELNQYHLLTKKVLFRLSYRGAWCSRSAKPFSEAVCYTQDPSDGLFKPDCGVCVFYAVCAFHQKKRVPLA